MTTAAVGELLPELAIEVDRTFIVAAALASQDFEDVHHDPGKAQERGTPDIFISINSTNGLIDRYVTDWAGPQARIASVSLRLGVPLFPGDTLRLAGEVKQTAGDTTVLDVVGSNERGVHVSAVVSLRGVEGSSS